VITAAFILPWGRERYLPNTLTKLAAYLFVLVMGLLTVVRQTQLLLLIDQAQNLHLGENPPAIQMYIRVSKRFRER
jgi:hypothetical protein